MESMDQHWRRLFREDKSTLWKDDRLSQAPLWILNDLLNLALVDEDADSARKLLGLGAQPNQDFWEQGVSAPILVLSSSCNVELLEILINAGADVNSQFHGDNPLYSATESYINNHESMRSEIFDYIKALLEAGANPFFDQAEIESAYNLSVMGGLDDLKSLFLSYETLTPNR